MPWIKVKLHRGLPLVSPPTVAASLETFSSEWTPTHPAMTVDSDDYAAAAAAVGSATKAGTQCHALGSHGGPTQLCVGVEPSFESTLGLRSINQLKTPSQWGQYNNPGFTTTHAGALGRDKYTDFPVRLHIVKGKLGGKSGEAYVTVGNCRCEEEAECLAALALDCLRCLSSATTQSLLDTLTTAGLPHSEVHGHGGEQQQRHHRHHHHHVAQLDPPQFAARHAVPLSPMYDDCANTTMQQKSAVSSSDGSALLASLRAILNEVLSVLGIEAPENSDEESNNGKGGDESTPSDKLWFAILCSTRGLVSASPAFFASLTHGERMTTALCVLSCVHHMIQDGEGSCFLREIPIAYTNGGVGSLIVVHIDNGFSFAFGVAKSLNVSATTIGALLIQTIRDYACAAGRLATTHRRLKAKQEGSGESGGLFGLCGGSASSVAEEALSAEGISQGLLSRLANLATRERAAAQDVVHVTRGLGSSWLQGSLLETSSSGSDHTAGPIRLGGGQGGGAARTTVDHHRSSFIVLAQPAFVTSRPNPTLAILYGRCNAELAHAGAPIDGNSTTGPEGELKTAVSFLEEADHAVGVLHRCTKELSAGGASSSSAAAARPVRLEVFAMGGASRWQEHAAAELGYGPSALNDPSALLQTVSDVALDILGGRAEGKGKKRSEGEKVDPKALLDAALSRCNL